MSSPTWPIGPARTRDGREARIYATDGGGPAHIHGAVLSGGKWFLQSWYSFGHATATGQASNADLIPPKLTRDEAIAECWAIWAKNCSPHLEAQRDMFAHWDKLKAEGRIDE
jgi:hypothetical protein